MAALGYVDTHCHLDAICERMKVPLAEVSDLAFFEFPPSFDALITVACEPAKDFAAARTLLGLERVYGAFGVHPHEAGAYTEAVEREIEEAMRSPKVLAWGECGLDYFRNQHAPELQRQVFARQIGKAVEHGKPLIVHTREAEEDTLAVLREHLPRAWPVHVHCFTSSAAFARDLLRSFDNLYLGFTGVITFKNGAGVREAAAGTPLERILLETDGPFMCPEPHRGKVAHAGHIPLIAAEVARVKGVDVERVFEQCRANTRAVYRI
eukprot:tig00001333_g8191.t1